MRRNSHAESAGTCCVVLSLALMVSFLAFSRAPMRLSIVQDDGSDINVLAEDTVIANNAALNGLLLEMAPAMPEGVQSVDIELTKGIWEHITALAAILFFDATWEKAFEGLEAFDCPAYVLRMALKGKSALQTQVHRMNSAGYYTMRSALDGFVLTQVSPLSPAPSLM